MTSPLLTLLRRVDDALAHHTDTPVFALSDSELSEALVLAHRVGNRLDEIELRIASQAASRDRDVKTAWVRGTHQAPRVAAARLTLAKALERREPLRVAMARGEVSEAQARVMVGALEKLPVDRLTAEVLDEAQATMIRLCGSHHPDELRVLGRKLLETIAPEIAEAEAAKRVEAEYRRAMEKRRLELWDRGDGSYGITGTLPAFHAHLLDKLLKAWDAPKHRRGLGLDTDVDADGVRLDAAQRRARAFCEFLERLNPHTVPYSGGVAARVVVNIDLDDLLTDINDYGVATVDGMVDIPAWEARRMACEAGLLPAVLGGKSEVLDLGRTRRFYNEPQRTGIHLRDKTCRAEGCDWPAWMCHIPPDRAAREERAGAARSPPHPLARRRTHRHDRHEPVPPPPRQSPRPHLRDPHHQTRQGRLPPHVTGHLDDVTARSRYDGMPGPLVQFPCG